MCNRYKLECSLQGLRSILLSCNLAAPVPGAECTCLQRVMHGVAWQAAASRPPDLYCNSSACAGSWAVSRLKAFVLCLQVQGDFVEKAAELIVKTYKDKGVTKKHVFAVVDKKTVPMFDEEEEDEQ